jgi:hypothetical protein
MNEEEKTIVVSAFHVHRSEFAGSGLFEYTAVILA